MPQPPAAPAENQIPLVVDLDGTLIKTDLLWESIARLLRRNPFWIFPILFWWSRSRAFLKKQLAARVKIDPATLPYHKKFLAYLREQKAAGRKIVLATASDREMALPAAEYVGLFNEVLGSDGKSNLRGANKLKALVEKFGEHGFDYAGNSVADLAVWRGARKAIVVNASRAVTKRASQLAEPGGMFHENYSPLEIPARFFNELFIRSGYLLAAAAGLLLAAAFPKTNVAGFAWIAPGLLVFAAQNKNGGDAFRVGYVGGLFFWLASLYWLLLMPVTGFPILGWLALSVFVALYFGLWTWLTEISHFKFHVPNFWSRRLLWSLGGAAIWVASEMIRARLLGGFPWSFIGASQFKLIPLIQIASITGVYGISFLVVWASLSLFSAVQMIFTKPKSRFAWQSEIILPFAAIVATFVFGEIKISEQLRQLYAPEELPPYHHKILRVTLIQPSIPQNLIWDENENSNRFQQLLALSENALTNKTDLLIWPESAVPELNDANYIAITNLIRTHHVWLIFNADDIVPRPNAANEFDNDDFNAAFLFNPDGNCAAIYHKQKLVIFGEYIPLARWLPFVKWFTPITGSFAAGNEPVQFEINLNRWGERPREPVVELNNGSSVASPCQIVKISPLICFEDTFPQLARKAVRDDTDFLVNLTNDGWFGDSAEQWQHEINAIFRAVENGVPLVRCCNNGVTCWIDANGRAREIFRDKTGSVYGAGAMTIELPLQNHAPTFYNRHGDWFSWSCVGIAGVLLAVKIFNHRRRK